MISGLEVIIFVVFFVWAGILTLFFLKFYLTERRISKNGSKKSFIETLEDIYKRETEVAKHLENLNNRTVTLEKNSQFYIQKVGLLRFNPFNDTGGDQSFILSLVDSEDTGVVISSLHTRGGTRWYAKRVENGKGLDHELSNEEVKAIRQAISLVKKKNK